MLPLFLLSDLRLQALASIMCCQLKLCLEPSSVKLSSRPFSLASQWLIGCSVGRPIFLWHLRVTKKTFECLGSSTIPLAYPLCHFMLNPLAQLPQMHFHLRCHCLATPAPVVAVLGSCESSWCIVKCLLPKALSTQ